MNANERKWKDSTNRAVNLRSYVFIRGLPSFVPMRAIRGPRFPRLAATAATIAISFVGIRLQSALSQEPAAAPEIDVQATVGEPLGVGKIIVRFAPGQQVSLVPGQRVALSDSEGRVYYPVYSQASPVNPPLTGRKAVDSITAYFLFRGDRQLRLTLDITVSGGVYHGTGIPVKNPDAHKALLAQWWKAYSSMVQTAATADGYPPQIENYLSSMLARRFNRKPPDIVRPWSGQADVDTIFGTLLGAESIRLAMQKETLLRKSQGLEEATLPLPAPVAPPAIEIPNVPGKVEIEPLARHVPAECFYLRCGSFANFQWLRTTVDTWGGNLRDLVAIRGLDYGIRGRLERQLALRETVLSKLLGDAVIADVALVGTDTFFREGAAVGVLFQARNGAGLVAAIGAQRQEALKANRNVSEKIVEIGGQKVSLLTTDDNGVRSFYAIDGDFHLVTTSQTVVRRFFEAGKGTDALSDLKEFRYARALMPLSRKDTLFIYLSDPWFRLLVSPQYRVEMTRRMQSEAEIELVHLARLAARSEKQPADTIDELIAAKFLPDQFGQHSDGSRLVASAGTIGDSLRGARRSFLPVPDVAVTHVTPTEDKAYQEFARMYLGQWQRVDPVMVGVKRSDVPGRRERVVFDVHISPYARQHYAFFAQFLAEADSKRVAPIKGNVIEGEARIGAFPGEGRDPRYRIFGGLRDFAAPFVLLEGRVAPSPVGPDNAPFYIGVTPAATGIPFVRDGNVPEGYSENTNSGWLSWVRKFEDFMVLAGQKSLLEEVTPQIRLEDAERPAQLRLRVGDLAPMQVAAILNAYGYERARRTSGGNADFMDALIEQLHVPAANARETMQEVLAARPVCPLRGDYKLDSANTWTSTTWAQRYLGHEDRVPADFKSPFLQWFHGLDLEFSIDATTLTTHIELELAP